MCLAAREKEFISYRNEMKWNYIAFEYSENISHEQSEYIANKVASKSFTHFIIYIEPE